MENRYIATFPAGCYEVIARQLKKFTIDELKILNHDESSVTFDSVLRIERLIELRFFTNVYMVLDTSNLASYKIYIKGESYRLIALSNGKPVPINDKKRTTFASLIEKKLNLRPNAAKYSADFVLIKRSGQDESLTLRLPRSRHKREELPKGALRPELANIILLIAGIKPKDVLLDPFAGYGSIPMEAVRGFGVKNILVAEMDEGLASQLADKGFKVVSADAAELSGVTDSSINKIVTDPPWGIYDQSKDLEILYRGFLNAANRVLKPKGITVILSGSEKLDEIINKNDDFTILKNLNILVSGKKTRIFKLQKN